MAHRENRLDVLRRNRRRVDRIGKVRDEAAILAEHFGQASADDGGTLIEHAAQNLLVGRNCRALFDRLTHASARHSAPAADHAAIERLTAPTAAAGIERERNPAARRSGVCSGCAPRSPHSDNGSLRRAAERTIAWSTSMKPGWRGSASDVTEGLSRAAAIMYCKRSFDPIDAKSTSNMSSASAAAGTSIMMPSGGRSCGTLCAVSSAAASSINACTRTTSSALVIIGTMTR